LERSRETAAFILEKSLRGPDGVILHGGGRRTVWVDTMYYTSAPLAVMCSATGDSRWGEEALRQCVLHARWLRDERTGCFRHDADPATGLRSAGLWARGNGWAIMALAETLACCPPALEGYGESMETYRSLAEGLLGLRAPSGLWRIVPDDADSHQETSGTAMILLGLLEGVTRGWLEESLLAPIAASFQALLAWIAPDGPATGALMGSQRPAGQGGWERHRVAELGECAYATGCMVKLVARLARAGLVPAPAPGPGGKGR
jgi:rhamnogalacturonyl hydrolase YesR